MRRALAAQTGLAVLLWFFAAPFFHLHAADPDGRRHHQEVGHDHDAIVHFHMPEHHGAGAGVDVSSPGEDEKPLDSFAIVQECGPSQPLPFVSAERVQLARPAPALAEHVVVQYRPDVPDPPALDASNPRAPPA
jgi:hypothetical protein